MITEFKSVRDVWKKLPTQRHARKFLEDLVWPSGRYCPHCGSVNTVALKGQKGRPGLYQCRERECRGQFTATTKTPLHATKLDLRIWIAAIFLVITSSKGISSVVKARILGVNQKTAWKLGHAIRELMDDRDGISVKLAGVVVIDEAYIGGKPKFKKGKKNKRGKGISKPILLVATDRAGQARAQLVDFARGAVMGPVIKQWVDPSALIITDSNTAYDQTGKAFAKHLRVNHSRRQYAGKNGAHINTAEAVNSVIQRALIGVYHRLGRKHLQRYVDEILWRWNHRAQTRKVVKARGGGTKGPSKTTVVWKPIPVVDQMRGLLCCAVGRQLRRTPQWGLSWP